MTPSGGRRDRLVVSRLRRTVADVLDRCGLRGGRIVAAVSGGQDSLALLDALFAVRADLKLELACAHFDHRLRGADSDADAEFVREFCETLGIECLLGTADRPPDSTDGRWSEEAARDARYAFLVGVNERLGADAVVLGHTATDQAETVLMNIVRGSGLPGLSGMRDDTRRRSDGGSVRLIRPLLSVPRKTTADYCRALALSPRIDATNDGVEFARNRVRNTVIPLLRTFNPEVEDALIRLAENAGQAMRFVEAEADLVHADLVAESEGGATIDGGAADLHPSVLAVVIRRAICGLRGDLRDVRQGHVDQVAELLAGPAGRSADLPGGIRARSLPDGVILRRGDAARPPPLTGEYPVTVPGETAMPGWTIEASVVGRAEGNGGPGSSPAAFPIASPVSSPIASPVSSIGSSPASSTAVRLHLALTEGRMWVRGWRPGDRIRPLGMAGTKKVQDLFVDDKVPRDERASTPVVVCERGIVWVVGSRQADWARVPSSAERWLRLEARRLP